MKEVQEVIWSYLSAKEQSHQMCRYCNNKIEYMILKKIGRNKKKMYVGICKKHAKLDK